MCPKEIYDQFLKKWIRIMRIPNFRSACPRSSWSSNALECSSGTVSDSRPDIFQGPDHEILNFYLPALSCWALSSRVSKMDRESKNTAWQLVPYSSPTKVETSPRDMFAPFSKLCSPSDWEPESESRSLQAASISRNSARAPARCGCGGCSPAAWTWRWVLTRVG